MLGCQENCTKLDKMQHFFLEWKSTCLKMQQNFFCGGFSDEKLFGLRKEIKYDLIGFSRFKDKKRPPEKAAFL